MNEMKNIWILFIIVNKFQKLSRSQKAAGHYFSPLFRTKSLTLFTIVDISVQRPLFLVWIFQGAWRKSSTFWRLQSLRESFARPPRYRSNTLLTSWTERWGRRGWFASLWVATGTRSVSDSGRRQARVSIRVVWAENRGCGNDHRYCRWRCWTPPVGRAGGDCLQHRSSFEGWSPRCPNVHIGSVSQSKSAWTYKVFILYTLNYQSQAFFDARSRCFSARSYMALPIVVLLISKQLIITGVKIQLFLYFMLCWENMSPRHYRIREESRDSEAI